MELPKELVDKLERDKAREKKLQDKIKSKNEYKRRKLNKAIKEYIRNRGYRSYRSRDIDEIARRHQSFFG